jgi:anti-sigma-K factor RskA
LNSRDYIASGEISLLVLGLLSNDEEDAIWDAAKTDAGIMAAIRAAEEEMLEIDTVLGKAPAPELKNKLFDKISLDSPRAKQVEFKTKADNNIWKFAVAASVSLALFTSYLAFDYYNKWQKSSQDYTALAQQNEVLADNVNRTNQALDQERKNLQYIASENTHLVPLIGLPTQPDASVQIFYNEAQAEVLVAINDLEALATDLDYQLWAIVDGKPMSIGIVAAIDDSILQKLAFGANASAFAITIEPKGGSMSPTMEQMVVYGAVKAT